nr:hypothetical protein GCM10025732_14010 [Glycomyces mayteni]
MELVDVVVALVDAQGAAPVDDVHALVDELLGDVGGLLGGEAAHPAVDRDGVGRGLFGRHAELGGFVDLGEHVGGGDERLRGDAVRQDAGPAGARGLDEGDVGAELGRHEGGLVPGRASADDRYSCHGARLSVFGMLQCGQV